jgi:hypothetical protein
VAFDLTVQGGASTQRQVGCIETLALRATSGRSDQVGQ